MITTVSDLLGHWQFTREIRHASGEVNLVDGSAGLTRKGDEILYNEVGALRVGAQEFQAERTYIWREEDGEVKVYFKDRTFFHAFSMIKLNAKHFCVPDTYHVMYDFGDQTWTSTWQVSGPRKDYKMITQYIKA